MIQINLRNILIILLVVIIGSLISDFVYRQWRLRIPGL